MLKIGIRFDACRNIGFSHFALSKLEAHNLIVSLRFLSMFSVDNFPCGIKNRGQLVR
jgi:hypothetical protein